MENLQKNKLSSECLEDQLIYEDYRDNVKRGIIDINEKIPLRSDDMCIMMLHWAVLMSDEEFIDYLLVNKVDIDAQINFLKGTALMVAVRHKKFDIVKKLINGGADVNALGMPAINRYNVPRMTPLAIAVENEDFRTAELLIDSGAKFYMVSKTEPAWTALTFAIFRQNERMVKLLLKNEVEIESKEEKEFLTSYIYQAIKNGTDEIVKIIWPYYPRGSALWIDYVSQIPRIVVERNSTGLLKYFLDNYDFDINVATKRYRSPGRNTTNFYNHSMLHTAAVENSETMVKYLLDAGIDVNIGPGTPAVELNWMSRSLDIPIQFIPNRVIPIIKEHLVKMIACNYVVSEINLRSINGSEFHKLRETCDKEIELLKNSKFADTNFSYYSILHKSTRKLAIRIMRVEDSEIFRIKFHVNFPLYRGMVFNRLEKALRMKKLIINAENILLNIFRYKLDYDFIRDIVTLYLSDKDLLKLSEK